MTLIVVSTVGETPDALYDAGRKAVAAGADWIEVRLDTPSGLPWDLRSFFQHALPCIATVRHELDGGRSGAEDRQRNDLLRRSLLAGARGIDIEVWNEEARTLVKEAHASGALAIVSRHVLDGTPSEDALVEMLREAHALGADVAKLATRVEGPADAAALVRAAQRAGDAGIPYALMAVNDPFLRLLAPALGMWMAYASVPGAPAAATGQVPAPELRAAHRGFARAPPLSGTTRAVFLLGRPTAHSKSPAMQNAAFAATGTDGCYLALDTPPASLSAAISTLKVTNALGLNLTIPHKEAALTLVDVLDASAREAGAVNTVAFRDGLATGHNTDGAGALDALHDAGVALARARALILGAGGAARALAHALKAGGADVTLANRTPDRAAALGFPTIPWDRVADGLPATDLLVNATSVGLQGESLELPLERLPTSAAVLDCVYGDTSLAREAERRGFRTVRGEAMLLHQGARAFTIWTGRPAPVAAMRLALEASS